MAEGGGGGGGAATAPVGQNAAMVVSAGQVAFFLTYLWSLALYLYAMLLSWRRSVHLAGRRGSRTLPKVHLSDVTLPIKPDPNHAGGGGGGAGEATPLISADGTIGAGGPPMSPVAPKSLLADMSTSPLIKCVMLDESSLVECKHVLQAMVEFGTIMLWFFLCDRTDLLPASEKHYDRDLFLFVFLILTVVAFGASLQPVRTPLLLNRPQTEEWKGWMQVLFLFYHYFEAREAYNAIRIFIAGYVWMTGFGNFSYYYRTGDFSVGRFAQMMWRLNFLVFFCCVVLQNEYMLYYICPMHTLFTVMVYGALAIAPHLNKSNAWLWAKIALTFLTVFVFWDIKRVFYLVWAPFDFVMGYTDPRKPSDDRLHEWYFRSSLDRYIWVYGMVCAMLHPYASKALAAVDEMPAARRWTVRALVAGATCTAFGFYYKHIYILPKLEYNKVHPYTSWIPLTCWMVVRNLTPQLRTYSMRLYGWLGCITLETYLSQFHIWLRSSVPNGQPKYLLTILPGYPMLNFAICSAMYVYISHRLFLLTVAFKDAAIPHDNNRALGRNLLLMLVMLVTCTALGWVAHSAGLAWLAAR